MVHLMKKLSISKENICEMALKTNAKAFGSDQDAGAGVHGKICKDASDANFSHQPSSEETQPSGEMVSGQVGQLIPRFTQP